MEGNKFARFRTEVIDIAHQIVQLADHRDGLLQADTMSALDLALEALERSTDVLTVCVSGLKYRVGLELHQVKAS